MARILLMTRCQDSYDTSQYSSAPGELKTLPNTFYFATGASFLLFLVPKQPFQAKGFSGKTVRTSLRFTTVILGLLPLPTHLPSPSPYLFSLDQLLVNGVWEGPQGTELAGALSAHEDTILIHDPPPADGNQRHTMAAHVLVQVEVSSLNLGAG